MKLEIYQADNDNPLKFRGINADKIHRIPLVGYSKVWDGEIEEDENIFYTLEKVFIIFNDRHPKGFKGHSLSVSDIVRLGDRYFYCQPVGWQEIDI